MKFDQHFLKDKKTLSKIASYSDIHYNDTILEIGPGPGYLTEIILTQKPKKLISIEIDYHFEEQLEKIKKENFGKFEYEIANALDFFESLHFNKIVANIPYSITEPLYEKILKRHPELVVLTHGKEFYDIVKTGLSKWSYYVEAFYDIILVETIEGTRFEPSTKTDSVIIRLERKDNPNKKDKLIQNLFIKKDRNIINCLMYSLVDTLEISKREAHSIIKEIGIELDSIHNFNQLSNEEFLDIVNKLENVLERDL